MMRRTLLGAPLLNSWGCPCRALATTSRLLQAPATQTQDATSLPKPVATSGSFTDLFMSVQAPEPQDPIRPPKVKTSPGSGGSKPRAKQWSKPKENRYGMHSKSSSDGRSGWMRGTLGTEQQRHHTQQQQQSSSQADDGFGSTRRWSVKYGGGAPSGRTAPFAPEAEFEQPIQRAKRVPKEATRPEDVTSAFQAAPEPVSSASLKEREILAAQEKSRQEAERRKAEGIDDDVKSSNKTKKGFFDLKDRTVCFTGTLQIPREVARSKAREQGAIVVGHVGVKTDILVVGDSPGTELDKAESLPVQIWSEAKFHKAVKYDPRDFDPEACEASAFQNLYSAATAMNAPLPLRPEQRQSDGVMEAEEGGEAEDTTPMIVMSPSEFQDDLLPTAGATGAHEGNGASSPQPNFGATIPNIGLSAHPQAVEKVLIDAMLAAEDAVRATKEYNSNHALYDDMQAQLQLVQRFVKQKYKPGAIFPKSDASQWIMEKLPDKRNNERKRIITTAVERGVMFIVGENEDGEDLCRVPLAPLISKGYTLRWQIQPATDNRNLHLPAVEEEVAGQEEAQEGLHDLVLLRCKAGAEAEIARVANSGVLPAYGALLHWLSNYYCTKDLSKAHFNQAPSTLELNETVDGALTQLRSSISSVYGEEVAARVSVSSLSSEAQGEEGDEVFFAASVVLGGSDVPGTVLGEEILLAACVGSSEAEAELSALQLAFEHSFPSTGTPRVHVGGLTPKKEVEPLPVQGSTTPTTGEVTPDDTILDDVPESKAGDEASPSKAPWVDHANFWSRAYSYKPPPCGQDNLTMDPALVANVEKVIGGYKLPASYLDLVVKSGQNGGRPSKTGIPNLRHPAHKKIRDGKLTAEEKGLLADAENKAQSKEADAEKDATAAKTLLPVKNWSFYSVFGISSLEGGLGDDELSNSFWVDMWGYPDVGVYFARSAEEGQDMWALDYRERGHLGEPSVVHVGVNKTLEAGTKLLSDDRRTVSECGKFAVTTVAPTMQAFLAMLEHPEELSPVEIKASTQDFVPWFGTIVAGNR